MWSSRPKLLPSLHLTLQIFSAHFAHRLFVPPLFKDFVLLLLFALFYER